MTAEAPPAEGHGRTVALLTLGCKLNQAETEGMARAFVERGFIVVDRPAAAAGFIINSCAVTHVAERKSRHLVRLAKRLSPGAPVVLTGCYPEAAGRERAEADSGADAIIPGPRKSESVDALLAAMSSAPGARTAVPAPGPVGGQPLRTRAFVKAQEGCNDVCAFCIVPYTRGRERSIPPAEVAAAVREREVAGVLEVVITGTQLGAYGRDCGIEEGPAALIATLLAETSVPRIRFSSLQPQDITPRLLALWEDPRLCRHFHLALQSGCERTLQRMRRRYSAERYREALAEIRAAVPGVAITTDVIVGFPGETDADFEESYEFCQRAGFAGMHVFPYSGRGRTLAQRLPARVPEGVKRARVERLLALAHASGHAFAAAAVGTTPSVLWEERGPDGAWRGLTDTYLRVRAISGADLRNRILAARVTRAADGELWGDVPGDMG
jgi:threonylcarbamoyladenosine tRNA methylthiotransferase MtaB